MNHNVFWYTQKKPSPARTLTGDVQADVAIVGGGMAGLSSAARVLDAGLSVALIEKDFCGAGASGKTSGFITPDSEVELSSLVSDYGPEKAKRIWEFVLSGVNLIRKNIERYQIECDYQVQDSLFIASNRAGWKHIKGEYEARRELGYESTLYDETQIGTIVGSKGYAGAVRYPKTFGINSYLYCQALRDALAAKGAAIYEKTPVLRIEGGRVYTAAGVVRARRVIVCADRFTPELGAFTKEIYHVQTFLGISKPLRDTDIEKIFRKDRMMTWDTNLIYNYFRATGGNRVLLGGGDVFYTYAPRVSKNTPRFKRRLTAYFRRKFPDVPLELEYVWPGMLGVSKDLLPVMGSDPKDERVWYLGAAAGLPWAAALGVYAAERIIAGRNEFDREFSWRRKFIIGRRLQTLLTTPVTYAISHGIAELL